VTCKNRQMIPANGRPIVKKVSQGRKNAMISRMGGAFLFRC
jgi:hypothetical protein